MKINLLKQLNYFRKLFITSLNENNLKTKIRDFQRSSGLRTVQRGTVKAKNVSP